MSNGFLGRVRPPLSETTRMTPSTILKLTRWAGVAAAVAIAIAMLLYPGGTFRNPSTTGYSFFQNSLSDLGSTTAWGGRRNDTGALFFAGGFALAALAGIGCFAAFVRVYATSRTTRYWARAAGAAGVLSCVGLVGAALTPQNRFPAFHGRLTLMAALACPVASLLLAFTSFHGGRFPRRVTSVGWRSRSCSCHGFRSCDGSLRPPPTGGSRLWSPCRRSSLPR